MSAASGSRSDTDASLDNGRFMDQEMATKAVEKAVEHGATYADIRLVSNQNTSISMRDGKVRNAIPGHDVGVTLRCLVDGSWGVYSTSDVKSLPSQVESTVRLGRQVARRRASDQNEVRLAEVPISTTD
nr:hypothetical protein [Candidatus Poseidoniaceae archaeon]